MGFIIVCAILASLAWVGDIFSWFWIGNGFIIDIILVIVALAITFVTVFLYKQYKNKKQIADNSLLSTKSKQESQQFTCFNCGEIISKSDYCSVCGSPKPVCVVCFSEFRKKEVIVQLPCCSNYAHKDHIKNYLDIKGICPKCYQEIVEEELKKISF